MKKIISNAALILACLAVLTACKDDNESNPTLTQPTEFKLNEPVLENGVIDLAKSKSIDLTWSQPSPYNNFDAPVVPTYFVQLSCGDFTKAFDEMAEDNTGADYVQLAETYSTGNASISTDVIAKALQQLKGWAEDAVPATQSIIIRVKSAIRDASFKEYYTIISNTVTLNAVPYYYELKNAAPVLWYMVGDCIGSASWDNGAGSVGKGLVPLFLVPGEEYDKVTGTGHISFTGYFPENGQFKFIKVPGSWDEQLNYTNVKNPGSFLIDSDGDNHNVGIGESGYYTINIDTKSNDVTIDKYTENVTVYPNLCIAGTFNDWSDTDLTPVFTLSGENHIWSYEVNGGDKLKVKIPGSWETNWGYKTGLAGEKDGDGNLVIPEGKWLFLFNDINGDYMLIEK